MLFTNIDLLGNIVWVMEWRRMRCTGHVARMGKGRGAYGVLVRGVENFGLRNNWMG
jgi:hypothetical protein